MKANKLFLLASLLLSGSMIPITAQNKKEKKQQSTIKGYVDFSNYDLHCLRFHGSLGLEEHIYFPLDFRVLVSQETGRIVRDRKSVV